jgi:membrane complex biogenesis BtpA family protein
MERNFSDIFGSAKAAIAVVHLGPLPGSPGFEGDYDLIRDRALSEAEALAADGFDGLIVENYGDIPFHKAGVEAETLEAMTSVVEAVRAAVNVPVGVNVLRNDYGAALAIAAECKCEFIRVNILVGAYVTPEGLIEGQPGRVLRMRMRYAPDVAIFADIRVKHAYPLAATSIEEDALDAVERGKADWLIVTGPRTGSPPEPDDLRVVKNTLAELGAPAPVLVGSGISPDNAVEFLKLSDGFIVGSYIRKGGRAGEDLDREKTVEIARIRNSLED